MMVRPPPPPIWVGVSMGVHQKWNPPAGLWYSPGMARPRRNYKLKWRSKKANHGRKPTRGRNKTGR